MPRRTLTPAELERVRGTDQLTLHKCLILGLVDPVPKPSPMSEEEGERVRGGVWPEWMHTVDDPYPWGFWRWSVSERGTCWNCLSDRCDICIHRQHGCPSTNPGDHVHAQDGRAVAPLLQDEGCVWVCPCPCPKTGPTPRTPPAAAPKQASEPEPGQPVLF